MECFSVNAWLFSAPVAGKWSRITGWGTKIKDQFETEFNAANLARMVENFGARKNDLSLCYDHQSAYIQDNGQPAPALGWFDSLALVMAGKVVTFATHSGAEPPDPSGLENGVYGRLAEVTPLGERLLPNYRYLSPMFTDAGTDESGKAIGYELIDVAATNTPFQDGVGLTFHRTDSATTFGDSSPRKDPAMDKELLAKLGLAEDASAEDACKAMKKFMEESDGKVKKLSDLEEKLRKFDVDPDNLEQNAAIHLKTGNVHDEGGRHSRFSEDEAAEVKAMADDLGVPAKMSAIRAAVVPMSKFSEIQNRLASLEAERAAEKEAALETRVSAFVDDAVAKGYPSDQKEALAKFARSDFESAGKLVQASIGSKLFSRVTTGGAPAGVARAPESAPSESGIVKMGRSLSAAIREFRNANPSATYMDAASEVAKKHPELAQAYLAGQ